MTTSHKPTYHPAVGSSTQGGFRYYDKRHQLSVKDLPQHTTLKTRQVGQNAPSEMLVRDLRSELLIRESNAQTHKFIDRRRQGHLTIDEDQQNKQLFLTSSNNNNNSNDNNNNSNNNNNNHKRAADEDVDGADVSSFEIDASESVLSAVDLSQFDDKDDDARTQLSHHTEVMSKHNSDDQDDDEENDDGDDEALLRLELERIKAEREAERKRKEADEALLRGRAAGENEADQSDISILSMNPLFAAQQSDLSAGVKRRWDDDVVFKNQTQGHDIVTKSNKRFINDTIRSDFHRNFIKRFIK